LTRPVQEKGEKKKDKAWGKQSRKSFGGPGGEQEGHGRKGKKRAFYQEVATFRGGKKKKAGGKRHESFRKG